MFQVASFQWFHICLHVYVDATDLDALYVVHVYVNVCIYIYIGVAVYRKGILRILSGHQKSKHPRHP